MTAPGAIAFLFPGQGAQAVGMGKDLHERFAEARALFDAAEAASRLPIRSLCFEGPASELARTDVSQPAIVAVSLAALEALRIACGGALLDPAVAAGLSLGEYAALGAAGAIAARDVLRLVSVRGRLMQECCDRERGIMVSVLGLPAEKVLACVADARAAGVVCLANRNASDQNVISGEKAAVEKAAELCKAAGAKRTIPLDVAGAYHSPLMEGARAGLERELAQTAIERPRFPVVSNVSAAPESDPARIRELLARQVTSPVLWHESMQRLVQDGVRRALEIGPGAVLAGLLKRVSRDIVVTSVADAASVEAAARQK